MNFFTKLFHRHNWQIVESKEIQTKMTHYLDGQQIGADEPRTGILVVRRCEVCGKENAYLSDGTHVTVVEVAWAKQEVGIL